ncbi:hypothetical protein [Mycobacterium sp.]|uniref:hypothetical protein n=1 Tax=Mycobacterium sp. TaxID=1785 RepID=UPI0031D889CE
MNKIYFIPYYIILKMYNDEKLRKEWIERNLERTVLNNYKNNVYKTIIYIVPINEIYQYENLDMKKYTIELENDIENPQKNA